MDDEGVSRTSDPDDDGSLQGFGNSRKNSQLEISVSWEEIAVKKSLEVREALEVVDVVGKVETHYSRPVPHEETKRRVSSRGCTLPLQVGDGEDAAGRDVADDVVGDFRFEAENVTDGMLVPSPL